MRHLVGYVIALLSGMFAAMTTTTGAIVNPQPSPQDFTSGGGVSAVSLVASAVAAMTNGSFLISQNPGRLQNVLVTVSAAQSWTFYDAAAVASGYTGDTIIGFLPASAAVGLYQFHMPAKFGIVAVPSATGTAAITASYN